ncbi:hypothetical protein IFM46972_10136 [Aspergillus udagawae]|uniref:Epoxide hydrolase n=1 Tax=Aspergillus udagawae TaxID=91492 RepID=A0A8H3SAJ6_9EURO|nr:hypothetical protein IFM46972_10136 [Aspergillus udagawae]
MEHCVVWPSSSCSQYSAVGPKTVTARSGLTVLQSRPSIPRPKCSTGSWRPAKTRGLEISAEEMPDHDRHFMDAAGVTAYVHKRRLEVGYHLGRRMKAYASLLLSYENDSHHLVPNRSTGKLEKLHQKLKLSEFPDELEDAQWKHGVPLEGEVEGAILLLFVHGWPGSFFEGSKLLPPLQEGNGKPAFHVVMPSLANYGFSGEVTKTPVDLTLQGDWGSYVARLIGYKYPQHYKASHFNMKLAQEPLWTAANPNPEYTDFEKAALKRAAEWKENGRGYFNIQSFKPATLAFSLRDSPTGLLAWIYKKLVDWSDNCPWTPEEVIT